MENQTPWLRSEKLDAFAAAFSKAQGEMEFASKDSLNPHFKSKYADLAADIEASRPALTKHGFSVSQPTKTVFQEGEIVVLVQTIVLHSSDQWIASEYPIVATALNSQQLKSALTYARRASYESILGIATEDDDGNEASRRPPSPQAKPSAPPTPKPAGEYRIPFGKSTTGKLLSEVPVDELASAITALQDKAYQNKMPLTGAVAEFVQRATAHLEALDRQSVENAQKNAAPSQQENG